MIGFVVLTLLAADQAGPTLAAVEALPPREAGDIVLAGKDHNSVEKVVRIPMSSMMPQGLSELELTERAVTNHWGCVRQRWSAMFKRSPDEPDGKSTLYAIYNKVEVAVLPTGGCRDGRYAALAGGLSPQEAVAALSYLDAIREGRIKVSYSCTDKVREHLCKSRDSIARGIGETQVRSVSRDGANIEFLLSERPGPFITVRYSPSRPNRVTVRREFPAPF